MYSFLRKSWWKYLGLILVAYSIVGGILFPVPELHILNETVRNLYYHVPMWFAMLVLMLTSLIFSIKYLLSSDLKHDLVAAELIKPAALFGVLGLVTGMIWANYTWGDWWHGDPKQNASAIAMLIYFAYLLLRNAIPDPEKKARISAVYNIFAFFAMLALLYVVPNLTDSLHPSNGGNPSFAQIDIDWRMRLVFYPAIFGWIFIGLWLAAIRIRLQDLHYKNLKFW